MTVEEHLKKLNWAKFDTQYYHLTGADIGELIRQVQTNTHHETIETILREIEVLDKSVNSMGQINIFPIIERLRQSIIDDSR